MKIKALAAGMGAAILLLTSMTTPLHTYAADQGSQVVLQTEISGNSSMTNNNSAVVELADGSTVSVSGEAVQNGLLFLVERITAESGTNYSSITTAMKDKGSDQRIYDLYFIDSKGQTVQPKGQMTVAFSLNGRYTKPCVYYVAGDMSTILMTSTVANDTISFVTDHNSYYVLAESKSGSSNNNGGGSGGGGNGGNDNDDDNGGGSTTTPQPSNPSTPNPPPESPTAPSPTVPNPAGPGTVVPSAPISPKPDNTKPDNTKPDNTKPVVTPETLETEDETGGTENDTEGSSQETPQAKPVEIQDNTPNVPEETQKLAEDNLPDNFKIGTYIDIDIDGLADENGRAVVTFEIPEELRPAEGEKRNYQIMRIYTDESGEKAAEILDAEIDGYTVTMEAELDSEYVIIYEDGVSFADSAGAESLTEGNHTAVLVLVTAFIAALAGGTFFFWKRRKKEE